MTLKTQGSQSPILAYSDESGVPGLAINKNDWFIVAIIFFTDKRAALKASKEMAKLRGKLRLPVSYEFHKIENPLLIQEAFYNLIAGLDFRYQIFAIRKNRNKVFSSEMSMARLIIDDLKMFTRTRVTMDRNPKLYAKLCKEKKM